MKLTFYNTNEEVSFTGKFGAVCRWGLKHEILLLLN